MPFIGSFFNKFHEGFYNIAIMIVLVGSNLSTILLGKSRPLQSIISVKRSHICLRQILSMAVWSQLRKWAFSII